MVYLPEWSHRGDRGHWLTAILQNYERGCYSPNANVIQLFAYLKIAVLSHMWLSTVLDCYFETTSEIVLALHEPTKWLIKDFLC